MDGCRPAERQLIGLSSTNEPFPITNQLEVIKDFAGEAPEVAKYYPEDKGFLLEFEANVVHYEVVGRS